MSYEPSTMWQGRLDRQFDLTGVGHASLSADYNAKMYATRLAKLQQLNLDFTGKSVLEIGCGTGFYTQWFAQQNVVHYTGLDITQVSIEQLTERFPQFDFLTADITEYVPPTTQYDYVFIADVLFHIVEHPLFQKAIQHMCQALKPGGRLILSDLLAEYDVQTARHVRFRSQHTYQQVLAEHDVTIQTILPIFALLHPPVLVTNAPVGWQLATLFWSYGLLRFGRQAWFSKIFANWFQKLDRRLLDNPSYNIPNLKWLVAQKIS